MFGEDAQDGCGASGGKLNVLARRGHETFARSVLRGGCVLRIWDTRITATWTSNFLGVYSRQDDVDPSKAAPGVTRRSLCPDNLQDPPTSRVVAHVLYPTCIEV